MGKAAMKTRRRWRWPVGFYHNFNRGARRLRIFADEADHRRFYRLLGKTATKQGVTVTAYCLVANHYHLVVHASGEAMGRMIRDLEKSYSRYFNRKTGFDGALFQGRFKSTWLPDLQAVAYVTRYVHGNARDLGQPLDRFRWSSVGAYLGWADVPAWLDPKPVLDYIGGPDAYRKYLSEIPDKKPRVRAEDEAQIEFVRHIEDRVKRLLAGKETLMGKHSFKALVCWVAIHNFALRPKLLALALGYASGRCVSAMVCRIDDWLKEAPAVRAILDQVLTK